MILGNVHGYDSLRTNIQGMRNIGLKRLHSWPKTLNYWKWNTEEKYINSSFLLPENFLKPRVFPLAVQQGRCALFIFSMTQPHGWNPTWLHSEREAVKTPHCKWQIFLHSGVVCVCVCVLKWAAGSPCGCHFTRRAQEASSPLFRRVHGTAFLSSVIRLDLQRRHARLSCTENTETLLKSLSKSACLSKHLQYRLSVPVIMQIQ